MNAPAADPERLAEFGGQIPPERGELPVLVRAGLPAAEQAPIVPAWTYVEAPWGPVLDRALAFDACVSCGAAVDRFARARCEPCARAARGAVERARPRLFAPAPPKPAAPEFRGLRVWTARLAVACDDGFNVTFGSGGAPAAPFAPSAELFHGWLTEVADGPEQAAAKSARYLARYRGEMRASYKARPEAWRALLARDSVTLQCYCAAPDRCHRGELARILEALGARYEGERSDPRAGVHNR